MCKDIQPTATDKMPYHMPDKNIADGKGKKEMDNKDQMGHTTIHKASLNNGVTIKTTAIQIETTLSGQTQK
ncbi:hypothetical protein NFHSH190041_12230 [Shewanella sp. NFH-SH190041]|nr:hypothetical protein NFHSH190041_12230 [Shewanella sp. NFH-SH190041]